MISRPPSAVSVDASEILIYFPHKIWRLIQHSHKGMWGVGTV